jgi:hypothetical protein
MIDELSPEFAVPYATPAGTAAGSQVVDQRELRGHIEVSAITGTPPSENIRDRAITRQSARQTVSCRIVTRSDACFSPIRQHPDPPALLDFVFRQSYRRSLGLRLNERPQSIILLI